MHDCLHTGKNGIPKLKMINMWDSSPCVTVVTCAKVVIYVTIVVATGVHDTQYIACSSYICDFL